MNESATHQSMFARLRDDATYEATWREIVARYGGRIFAWARRRGLDEHDGEDVTQQVLLQLSNALRKSMYDAGKGRFRAFLCTMTKRVVIDFGRKEPRFPIDRDTGRYALDSQEARDDLFRGLEQEYDLELFALACRAVRDGVGEDVWRRFALVLPQGLGGAGMSVEEAAAEADCRPALIYQSRYKIIPLLKDEVSRLGGVNPLGDGVA